jgi:hypothetical protein
MDFFLDGYQQSRTKMLEDFDAPLSDSLSALASQTWVENPLSSLSRLNQLSEAGVEHSPTGYVDPYMGDMGEMESTVLNPISKEEALRQAKEAGVELDFPKDGIPQERVDLLIKWKREEVKRKFLIEKGPSGFIPGVAKIGTALGVSILDPVNIASAFVPVVSQANQVRLMSRLGKTGGRFVTGATEGLVGAALVEPFIYGSQQAQQADYDIYDSYLNLTIGTVLGGGLHAGIGKISDVLSKQPAQVKADMLQGATAQALENKQVDITPYLDSTGLTNKILSYDAVNAEISAIRAELSPIAEGRISRGDLKKLNGEIKNLEYDRGGLFAELEKNKVTGGQKFKKQGLKKGEVIADLEKRVADVDRQIALKQRELAKANEAREASGAIKALDSGIIPKRYQQRIDSIERKSFSPLYKKDQPTHPMESDPIVAQEAQVKYDARPANEYADIDEMTNDIITGMRDSGVDVKDVETEIKQMNELTERDANGIRQMIACMVKI